MKISEKNKEAIKSSILAGVGFWMFWYGIVSLAGGANAHPLLVGSIMGLVGLVTGLLTTWYTEE